MVDAVTRDATHLAPAGAGSTDASGAESAIPLGAGTEQGLTGDAPPAFPEPSELIEPGRALAIADFAPPSLGAGERLIRLAYRAGVPASMLTLPLGRKSRPRILAAVANPLRGDAAAGKALRAGQ